MWPAPRRCAELLCGNPPSKPRCELPSTVIAHARGRAWALVPQVWLCAFERQIVATTDQTVSGVQGRYANALFQLATEANRVEAVGTELAQFQNTIEASPELKRLVLSPVYSAQDQIAALEGIGAGLSEMTLNFLKLVAKNRRLAAISAIIATYQVLHATAKGEVQAEAISSQEMSTGQIIDLKEALKASIGRDVQLSTKVDASILGGLIVKVGSRMLDNSLKTKLSNLKIAMKGTG